MSNMLDVSVKGKSKIFPALQLCGVNVLTNGKLIKTAEIFDEYWLQRDQLPSPDNIIQELSYLQIKPDIFIFTQRVPDKEPKYGYHYDWENYAVLPISTYENWFQGQIHSTTNLGWQVDRNAPICCFLNLNYA